jgi:predicted Rdx family selenoprotein
MAVSVAAELSSINYRETGITLTPAGKGAFQVFLNGKKVYDRKEPGAVDFLPALKEIHKIRESVRELFAEEPATAGAH